MTALYDKFLEITSKYEDLTDSEFMYSDVSFVETEYTSEENIQFIQDLHAAGLTVKLEEHHGGEGEGEVYYSVYSITDGKDKSFIRYNGFYQSYNGAEFLDKQEVYPRLVTETQYFTSSE